MKMAKKLLLVVSIVALMVACVSVVAVAAESYMDKGPAICEYEVTVKKADPSVVKKDGVIDVEDFAALKSFVGTKQTALDYAEMMGVEHDENTECQ